MPFGIKTVLPVLPKPDNLTVESSTAKNMNSIEDKELRKKLRNRQSALAARERKKARMLELERKVDELQQSNNELMDENSKLKRTLSALLYSPAEQRMRDSTISHVDRKVTYIPEKIRQQNPASNPIYRTHNANPNIHAVDSQKYANYSVVPDQQQFTNSITNPIDYSMQSRRKRVYLQDNSECNVVQKRVIKVERSQDIIPNTTNIQYHGMNVFPNNSTYSITQNEVEEKRSRLVSLDQYNDDNKDRIRGRLHSSSSVLSTGYQTNSKRTLPPIDAVLQSPSKTLNSQLDGTENEVTNSSMPGCDKNSFHNVTGGQTSVDATNMLQPTNHPFEILPNNGSTTNETSQRDPYLHLANDLLSYQSEDNCFSKPLVTNSKTVLGNLDNGTGNNVPTNEDNAVYMRLNENLTGYSPLDSISSCDSGVGIDDDSLEWIQKVPIF